MRIAVATTDWVTIAGHAGQARRWLVFDEGAAQPVRLELTKEQVFHHWKDDGPHPLDGVAAVIAGHAGEGFLSRMRARGIEPVLTGQTDPALAVAEWRAAQVTPAPPRPLLKMFCRLRDVFSEHRRVGRDTPP